MTAEAYRTPRSLTSLFTVTTEHGLHARPAAQLVKTVTRYPVDVEIRCGEKSTSGTSLFELLMLGITSGAQIEVTATGRGAEEVMNIIERLVNGRPDGPEDAFAGQVN